MFIDLRLNISTNLVPNISFCLLLHACSLVALWLLYFLIRILKKSGYLVFSCHSVGKIFCPFPSFR